MLLAVFALYLKMYPAVVMSFSHALDTQLCQLVPAHTSWTFAKMMDKYSEQMSAHDSTSITRATYDSRTDLAHFCGWLHELEITPPL